MRTPIYSLSGTSTKTQELDGDIFGVEVSRTTTAQVLRAQIACRHQVSANTKTKGEVRGGGRKPWKQKGTGRARAGSNRSPIWRGGGITFGPSAEKNPILKVSQKMKRQATKAALADKYRSKSYFILDIPGSGVKRNEVLALLGKLKIDDKKILFITAPKEKEFILQIRNLSFACVIGSNSINLYDLLNCDAVVMTLSAYKAMTARSKEKI